MNDETRAQAGEEVKVGAGNGVDPTAIASQLADEAAAAQVEADKVGRILVYQLDAFHNVFNKLAFVSIRIAANSMELIMSYSYDACYYLFEMPS